MEKSNRYLITGGAGFIGSNFVKFVSKQEPEAKIVVLDKLTYSANLKNLEEFVRTPNFEFVQGDICDSQTVKSAAQNVNYIVNFAAEAAVDRSIDDPDQFLKTDIYGVFVLLNEARNNVALKKFIQVSTDEVYGHILDGSFKEDAELKPRNPYAAAKLGGDRLAYSFSQTYGLPVCITRASNNYGPYAYPEKVIPLFITNLIDGLNVPVYGAGDQIRDWLYVDDHCSAIYEILKSGVNGEVYNVGGSFECTNLDLTKKIIQLMGKNEGMITYVEDRPGHDFRYSLNCDKLKSLGWKQKYTFEDGLNKTIDWYIHNEEWWRPVKEKMERKYITGYWGNKK